MFPLILNGDARGFQVDIGVVEKKDKNEYRMSVWMSVYLIILSIICYNVCGGGYNE